jgi:hypothetical protein
LRKTDRQLVAELIEEIGGINYGSTSKNLNTKMRISTGTEDTKWRNEPRAPALERVNQMVAPSSCKEKESFE